MLSVEIPGERSELPSRPQVQSTGTIQPQTANAVVDDSNMGYCVLNACQMSGAVSNLLNLHPDLINRLYVDFTVQQRRRIVKELESDKLSWSLDSRPGTNDSQKLLF